MDLRFGNAIMYAELKAAYEAYDVNRLYALIGADVETVCNVLLNQSKYRSYNRADREDVKQSAWMHVQDTLLEKFFSDPRNDPAAENCYAAGQKNGWLYKCLSNYLTDQVKKFYRIASVDSIDRPLSADGEITIGTIQKDPNQNTEEVFMRRTLLIDSMRTFYSLKNAPELLAGVGYVILETELESRGHSYNDYVDALNGCPAARVVRVTGTLLHRHQIERTMLSPLKKRLQITRENPLGDGRIITGLTAKTLANRKNSMLTTLREQLNQQQEEDDFYDI